MNNPIPIINAKGRIFNAVMIVWNFPPPSTLRIWIIMNTITNVTATNFKLDHELARRILGSLQLLKP